MKKFKQNLMAALWVWLLLWGCTENPFSDTIFSGTNGQGFSGTVRLENSADPSGVFVWFKEFNLKTYTDAGGRFTFELPPKQQSHPGGGLTGYYTVYFYLENYELVAKQVYLFDGAIDYEKSEIEPNGQFTADVYIRQWLMVHTYLDAQQMNELGYSGLIISAELRALHAENVHIITQKLRSGGWGSLLLMKQDAPLDSLKIIDRGSIYVQQVGAEVSKLSLFLPERIFYLSPGTYLPVPYFYLERDLPDGLVDALGREKRLLSPAFLQLPLRYESTPFTITP